MRLPNAVTKCSVSQDNSDVNVLPPTEKQARTFQILQVRYWMLRTEVQVEAIRGPGTMHKLCALETRKGKYGPYVPGCSMMTASGQQLLMSFKKTILDDSMVFHPDTRLS